ncbi:MAG: hypothetical protein COV37_05050 [Bdellovibrio sp. CG11_big_fil_rev_8_21_14_0_20_39_38]|nr:MAG: hypothetical protein COV37_05050 [Bdellovibrio sp. CG11_big_fil_rev_8_21_14_0_20_39_38]
MDIQEEFKKLKELPNRFQSDSIKVKNLTPENSMLNSAQKREIERDDLDLNNLGRPSLPFEEKAKPITIRLHPDHLELLEFIPGEGNAEKVRWLLDTLVPMRSREQKQMRTMDAQIEKCYRLAKMIHNPESFSHDEQKRTRIKSSFLEEFKALEALVNVLGFNYTDLKRGLDHRRGTDIDIIFIVKENL